MINDFRAQLTHGGARPNLYKVTLPFPAFAGGADATRRLSFLCKASSLPGSTIGMAPANFRGRVLKLAGDRSFEPWSVTVYSDGDFLLRDAFEKWSNAINEHEANLGVDPNDYFIDASVEQLDRKGEVISKYDFHGIWPSDVSAIALGYETNDQIEEFEVTLQYQLWRKAGVTT